eukprot:2951292-Alexandrium_andersonii.AAC.1
MGNSDQPQTVGGTLDDARQLGFAGTQSNGLLGRGPMLNRAQPPRTHAPPHMDLRVRRQPAKS